MSKQPIILGIDPGTQILGFAILKGGSKPSLIEMDVLKLTHEKDIYARLQLIHAKIIALIKEHKPTDFAIEAPFFGKNVQSMLKLGRAQGVAIAAALSKNIPITEYSPKKIKMSITGNGNASKEQVAAMLKQMLGIDTEKHYLDATDALGAAVCHHFQNKTGSSGAKKSYGSWKAFVNDNPKRKL